MCVLVTFDINLTIIENIHESGVIKYVWTSTGFRGIRGLINKDTGLI